MATEAALVFAPEVIEMHARTENHRWWTLTISASDALLKDAQDLYAKEGFTECSTRDAFDRPPSSDHFFLDVGKLRVRRGGFFAYPQHLGLLLRPCLAALAARGLAPAPAEPAALAAVAADPQAAKEEDLDELRRRAVQPGGLRSLWLPRAPPARPAAAAPAGVAVLRFGKDGAVTEFLAPEDLRAEVERRWPAACRDMVANFEGHGMRSVDKTILPAMLISAWQHYGYERVAPQEVAEQARARGHDVSADFGTKLELLALDAQRIFLLQGAPWQPGASAATACRADFEERMRAQEASSRQAAEAMRAELIGALREQQDDARANLEAVRSQAEEQQARLTAESACHAEEQRSFRHELRQAEEQQARLSAESARHAEEQRSLRDELHQASDARDELSAKVRETQHNGSEALEALRAELMQALNEHQEELRVQAEQIQAEFQAKVEESARHAEEQRTLRSGLQEALEVQRSSHEALRAELMEAVREQQEDAREKREVGMEALEDLRSQVNVLVTGQREHDEEVAALKAKLLAAEQGSAEAKDKPCFRIYDVDGGTAGAAKHIRIECPGAEVDDITIEDLCNGVHVHIAVSTNLPTEFDKEFVFDRRKDGFFELRQDECWYENGVLLLVLRGTLPKRMKLKQGGPPSAQRASLATVLEEVQCSQGEGNGQTPMYYDIASVHFEGSHDADSRSSWMPVDVDARGSAWPQSEQDAMSIGKESLGEASQQSSWVIPNGAASSRPGASQAPSSHGSGAASLATVRSVASAPARGTAPRCFLPGTAFRREETGEYVRAAELMRAGGDKLVGPGGSQVLVSSAIKHAAVERDLVSLRLRGVSAAFVVTADHQLLARGPKDKPVARSAGEFARGTFLFDGTDFHHVEQAKLFKYTCQVVELSFEGDAAALAWVVPRRSRSSGARVPVAVLGKEPTLGDRGVCAQRTFLDVPSSAPSASAGARSRSAGSRPALGSSWSVGSQGHDDKQPGQCDVCSRHHFYLKSLSGPNPGNAKPCPEGASCRKCHAPHPEYSGEGRSA